MDAHNTLLSAIAALRPGAQWVLRGDTLEDLEWLDTAQTAPTQAEVDTQLAKAPVPDTVTQRQARLALLDAGLLDQVEQSVNAAGGATKIAWDFAVTISRDDPLVTSIGAALNLTSDQIDVLFRYAAKQPS